MLLEFALIGLAAGYLAGVGRSGSDRTVLGLATAQRNISAAIVVAISLGGDVIVLTLVGALVLPIALIILAAELGKRSAAATGSDPEATGAASTSS